MTGRSAPGPRGGNGGQSAVVISTSTAAAVTRAGVPATANSARRTATNAKTRAPGTTQAGAAARPKREMARASAARSAPARSAGGESEGPIGARASTLTARPLTPPATGPAKAVPSSPGRYHPSVGPAATAGPDFCAGRGFPFRCFGFEPGRDSPAHGFFPPAGVSGAAPSETGCGAAGWTGDGCAAGSGDSAGSGVGSGSMGATSAGAGTVSGEGGASSAQAGEPAAAA